MASKTHIEWSSMVWNPITGCEKISPGCKYCYAEKLSARLQAMGAPGYENGFDKITLLPERLHQPFSRKKSTTYFVNSMSDLFHKEIPFEYIDQVFDVIKKTKQHTYQILTKRAERMREYFTTRHVPDNVWLGVSVEDVRYGLPRIIQLQQISAPLRFLSVEPLLEDLGIINLVGIHWVIVGGESASKARPMAEDWVIKIRDQCLSEDVPFFFKQWGSWGQDGVKRSKRTNGRSLQGKLWDMIPTKEIE